MNTVDSLLPFAPARVRALLLPLGPIRSERFALFAERLQAEGIVPLCDVAADPRPHRNMFTPMTYPNGTIFYEFVTYMPPASQLSLSPFDLYREPLVILAIADGAELTRSTYSTSASPANTATTLAEKNIRALDQELEGLRDQYHRALVHQVVLFEYDSNPDKIISIPEGIVTVPTTTTAGSITPKMVMCDLSSRLLAEMQTMAKSIEGVGYVDSPGQVLATRGRALPDEPRRNSQVSMPISRSSAGAEARNLSRMSMPPLKTSLSNISRSRPRRPSNPIAENSAVEGQDSGRSTPEAFGSGSRTATPDGFRSPPPERISVQGFGSNGINEKLRQKGKSRVQIVIGSMYLQAGRWSNALKELSEGAAISRALNDHIWHGKALELILCCLFAMGWAELEFSIPQVCAAALDRPIPEAKPDPSFPDQPRHLRALQAILPDLLDRILGLYSRVSAEKLPQLPMSEAIIRFCKIMSAMQHSNGLLNKTCFDILVEGKWPEKQLTTSPRFTISPTRQTIVTLLFKAFPASSTELLTVVDRAAILSGICFVLGKIGYHRKKTMVSRELMSVLISGLVEARTRGAADVGIHPAAGLISLTGPGAHTKGATLELQEEDVEQGISNLLDVMCRNYGVIDFEMPSKMGSPVQNNEEMDTIVSRIRRQSAARLYGFPGVKLNMLRACINFCEALPDFQGVLKYSSDLLRTAGSGVAPGPRGDDASPMIPREEQTRLLTNISKTYELSRRLGVTDLAGEYWDEFLVRGVSLEPLPEAKAPVQHTKSIIPGVTVSRTSQDVNPFIYNPFLKADEKEAQQSLVAMEPATFKVTLQNPYDIEVNIESISLVGEGIKFESDKEHVIIGSYRTHVARIVGIPQEGGTLRITGARIKVNGCRERVFPIIHDRWVPSPNVKIKAMGMQALQHAVENESLGSPPLKPTPLELHVINEQPLVVLKSTTLPQSSIMILEGERKRFRVTLENTSKKTAVNFILFSFDDSTQAPLRAALQNRDSTPSEMYEYELILMKKQVLRIHKQPDEKRHIAPRGKVTYEFEILGKPGLTSASIQIDYAYLGDNTDDIGPKFHTRRISLPITVTVNGSVEISRCDVMPLFGPIPAPLWEHVHHNSADGTPPFLSSPSPPCDAVMAEGKTAPEDCCLLSLDLRNIWPSNMQVTIATRDSICIDESVLPGNTTRVVLPIRRIHLENPHLAIPALNPNRNRQFVVSSSKVSPDFERNVREAFWYREHILDNIQATWRTTSGPKHSGAVELRSIRLTARMIEAIKVEDVSIDISLEDENGKSTGNLMAVDAFSQVRVRVTNRSPNPIFPLLRLVPALCHRPANMAMESTRKFAWNGVLQRRLPLLGANGSTEVVLGFTALCRGKFEITASVEEAMLFESESDKAERKMKEQGRQRADTEALMEAAVALGIKERRIWHTRQPCVFTVVDEI
ncbi:Transport protein particle subunit trs120 [Ceratocystis fimbriata CBS 114723]|uniref:Transport protein particle subunit trs120 n=1 Tax=Ceratocystis fimbriata CBS 114723 TaxID=1035309 RepID=A0A2C5X192_9PEZI|nr:Transport protein particle subunit trs120 [Ceratocystis fimbriata CBS 114723]